MSNAHDIRTAIRVLEAFKRVDPEISLPAMLTFLYIVEADGQSGNQHSIDNRLDMSTATVSRSVSHWSEYKRPRVPGLNLVESIPDPEDRRYRSITLNRRGLEFASKISEAVNGTSKRD